uniref:NADH dehydrogenase subunit 6 n=1 Tax=Scelio sp. ZJUH_2016028 TaxID=2496283 RepID=A0A3S8V192_9HYME|nr:NADH dehydrogenase subunit 6 [Scelio sp. ZJUH_2016028]
MMKILLYFSFMNIMMNMKFNNFITFIMIILFMAQNFNNKFSTPFKLNIKILLITFIIIILMNFILKVNMFSIIIFLMMISGLMILFLYFNSFSKNKININLKNNLNLNLKYMMTLMLIYFNLMNFMPPTIKKSMLMNPMLMMMKIYPSNMFIIYLILLLMYIMIISSYLNSMNLKSLRKT